MKMYLLIYNIRQTYRDKIKGSGMYALSVGLCRAFFFLEKVLWSLAVFDLNYDPIRYKKCYGF